MALTAKQRAKLPKSAFAYNSGPRSSWRFPVPTKAQAAKAGISAAQNLRIHANARARAAQKGTSGSKAHVTAISNKRVANMGKPAKTRHR
jgi:hypothetical protein